MKKIITQLTDKVIEEIDAYQSMSGYELIPNRHADKVEPMLIFGKIPGPKRLHHPLAPR